MIFYVLGSIRKCLPTVVVLEKAKKRAAAKLASQSVMLENKNG